jgi:hypothetical protein
LLSLSKARRNKEKKTRLFYSFMMPSNQTMKVSPKCSETVIPDIPRVGIGLNTVPDPSVFKKKVMFKDFYPPETVATTSTATESKFGRIDDDVPVRFNPRHFGTTPEMSLTGRLAEAADLIGSKTVKKKLFFLMTQWQKQQVEELLEV